MTTDITIDRDLSSNTWVTNIGKKLVFALALKMPILSFLVFPLSCSLNLFRDYVSIIERNTVELTLCLYTITNRWVNYCIKI